MAVGDIVKVLNGQYLPADMVLFSSRSGVPVGTGFEMNIKDSKVLSELQKSGFICSLLAHEFPSHKPDLLYNLSIRNEL